MGSEEDTNGNGRGVDADTQDRQNNQNKLGLTPDQIQHELENSFQSRSGGNSKKLKSQASNKPLTVKSGKSGKSAKTMKSAKTVKSKHGKNKKNKNGILNKNKHHYESSNQNQNSRRKNFSSFTSKIRSDRFLLYLVIFMSLVMVNIPLLIDYILMSGLLSKVVDFNDSAITSKYLQSEIFSMYGLFYAESLNLYNGRSFSTNEALLK